ncbi:MAG: helix-turn-helix transcriptional regulator [Clostridiales bacterium]|nr:helix-turn-helix transcriptional regulator [Clostridiales bacterium]
MRLCTECHWDDWDRIVDIYPERCDKLPEYINDNENYKIIILEKGALEIRNGNEVCTVKAPALIQLSQKDKPDYRVLMNIKAYILFFNPTVIREEFVFAKLDSGEFEKTWGSSFYQDYVLIREFAEATLAERTNELTLNSLKRLKELYMSTEKELTGQRDGFWPCRSRSYLMELLYYIEYTFFVKNPDEEASGQDDFALITDYMNEHIEDQITLDTITKKFAINRNKLNELFMKHSSMTCMSYLQKLRLDLGKILLTKTDLPVSEISLRVGYPDSNYFTKLFKKTEGMTPTQYRKA